MAYRSFRFHHTAGALTLAALLVAGSAAWATKPCPPPPCRSSPIGDSFDAQLCFRKATWVAVGRIVDVVRDRTQKPRYIKSFDLFTFRIQRWEKGRRRGVRDVRFRVGWCKNAQTIPRDYRGRWRIYGSTDPLRNKASDEAEYLELRKL